MKRIIPKTQPKKQKSVYEKFYDEIKAKNTVKRKLPESSFGPEFLNKKQRIVYDTVVNHINKPTSPLRVIVQGQAGTGKSAVIKAVCKLLKSKGKTFKIGSFTGCSAHNVGGYTLHHIFGLQMYYHNQDPRNITPSPAMRELETIDYFLIDEFSLIGLHLFGFLDQRLQALHRNPDFFGGKNVLLFGDISQLRPVGERSLFAKVEEDLLDGLDLAGHLAYKSFTRAIILTQQMRQSDPKEEDFRNLLADVRRGKLTPESHEKLASRYFGNLTQEELESFAHPSTVYIFPERASVHKYNLFRLENLGTPIETIMPWDSRNAPPETIEPLLLAKGARVFLNVNLAIEVGLFNGAAGTVTEIGQPGKRGVEVVYVRFDRYLGKPFGVRTDIPIIRHQTSASSTVLGMSWTRRQFPLTLNFANTIHKNQGMTLDRVAIGLPRRDEHSMFFNNSPGMFYVALSRVRRLSHVTFTKPFVPEVVVKKYRTGLLPWEDEENRLLELENNM